MNSMIQERTAFVVEKNKVQARAAGMVALQLCCGLDLATVLAAGPDSRMAALRRLDRLVERERLKGHARHWSYDLNRHIALKQAGDMIRACCSQVESLGVAHMRLNQDDRP